MNRLSKEDENYEKIKEIKEDNIEAANRQLKSRKKMIVMDTERKKYKTALKYHKRNEGNL